MINRVPPPEAKAYSCRMGSLALRETHSLSVCCFPDSSLKSVPTGSAGITPRLLLPKKALHLKALELDATHSWGASVLPIEECWPGV